MRDVTIISLLLVAIFGSIALTGCASRVSVECDGAFKYGIDE